MTGSRVVDIKPVLGRPSPKGVRAATALHLLLPQLPLLFMGEEWGAPEPFLYFSDLGPPFGASVSEGRRREFARFPAFADPAGQARIPDPQAEATRDASTLDWARREQPPHRGWLDLHRELLRIRREAIVPLLATGATPRKAFRALGGAAFEASWAFPGDRVLRVAANLGPSAAAGAASRDDWGRRLFALGFPDTAGPALPPWSIAWFLRGA